MGKFGCKRAEGGEDDAGDWEEGRELNVVRRRKGKELPRIHPERKKGWDHSQELV